MVRPVCQFCLCLLLLMAGAAVPLPAGAEEYEASFVGGEKYLKLNDVFRWFHLSPIAGAQGRVQYGGIISGKHITVGLVPQKQDFYVNSYRYILSFPVRREGEDLLISAVDVHKVVDPVLRPKFSKTAGTLRTVVIDPGHGGHDAGAVSRYAREKDCNLAVGLKLRKKLQKLGFKVVMTRDSDFFLTLQQRVQIANATPDSIFISIHHNSSGPAGIGIETFTLAPHGTTSPFARTRRTEDLAGNNQDSENIALATAVHSRAIRATKAADRGIQRARFSVLCTIRRPAILFEGGFVSNPIEGTKIATPAYQELLAEQIAQGVIAYRNNVCSAGPAGRPASSVPKVTPSGKLIYSASTYPHPES